MVNAINMIGGVKLQEHQQIKDVPEEVLDTQGASAIKQAIPANEYRIAYESKYKRSIKNWYRRNVGTYPKWVAFLAKRAVRFCFKHFFKNKIEFIFRGRGKRIATAKKYGFTLNYHRDLPIRYAKRVAVYVTIYRRN